MKLKLNLIALALAATTFAAAQEGPGGPPPQGGPGGQGGQFGRQGGPGGQMQRRPMGPPMGPGLLMNKSVQVELKLTEDQIDELRELLPPMQGRGGGPGGQRGFGGPGGGGQGGPPRGGGDREPGRAGPGGQGGPPREFERQGGPGGPGGPEQGQRMEQLEREVKKILTKGQFQRYKEINLQVQGAPALGRPDIAAKVGLSDDQVDEIHDILDQGMRPRRDRGDAPDRGRPEQGRPDEERQGQGRQPRDQEAMQAEMKARRAEVEKKILALLTGEQRKAWDALKGKPFELKMDPPRERRDGE